MRRPLNAVHPMLSFLKPAKHDEFEEMPDDDRLLLDEFAAFDVTRQSEVADQLAVLWQCFVDEFSTPAAFQREPRTKQDAYLAKFERVAARTEEVKHTENGHLHYSVALMLHFLRVARDGVRQQSALELSARVANLINGAHDRRVAERRGQFVNALSTSLVDKSAQPTTEVIVDRPVSVHTSDPPVRQARVWDSPAKGEADRITGDTSDDEGSVKRPRVEFVRRAG